MLLVKNTGADYRSTKLVESFLSLHYYKKNYLNPIIEFVSPLL